jgi:hypothetical protein
MGQRNRHHARCPGCGIRITIVLLGDDGHHGAANSATLALAKNKDGAVIGLNAATLLADFKEYRPML